LGVVIFSILVLLGVGACSSTVKPLRSIPKETDRVLVQQSEEYASAVEPVTSKVDFSDAPVGTWINPPKVYVGNMFPGARAESTLYIHNGAGEARPFSVFYMELPVQAPTDGESSDVVPVNSEGYARGSEDTAAWVKVSDSSILIGPNEVAEVLVVLELPDRAEVPAEMWGFMIGVSDDSQVGMVQIQLASKWLVTMRS